MGNGVNKNNNMRVRRPDIANYMDNYNKYYEVLDKNIPEQTSFSGNSIVHCRCEYGHDFSQVANKISNWKTDNRGIIFCPQCHKEGIRKRPYIERKTWKISFDEFCKQNGEKRHLLDEWDYDKNEQLNIKPKEIGAHSKRKAWWICPHGHSYDMHISLRTKGSNCPVCHGHRVLVGSNDFASQHPEVLKDWDYNKNTIDPTQIREHASCKVHWKCHKCGHEWAAQVSHRTRGKNPSGCPNCINHGMSKIDMCLYLTLLEQFPNAQYRDKRFGCEFDIFVPDARLAIEYDGLFAHRNKEVRDQKKDLIAKNNNISFLRIKETKTKNFDFRYEENILYINANKNTNYKEICKQMLICLQDYFNIQVNLDVDDDIIKQSISAIHSRNIQNSLATKFPEIANEWHPTKNGNIKPQYIDAHSHTIAWWICSKCNNEYQKPVHRRTQISRHSSGGCPYCCGQRRKKGYNDLETLHPGILSHWSKELNDELGLDFYQCAPRGIQYSYWEWDGQIQKMQIRAAVSKFERIYGTNAETT